MRLTHKEEAESFYRNPLLAAFSARGVDQRDLLKTGVIVTAYNQHARLLPSEPLVGDSPKVYSVRGSRHLHEISLKS